MGNVIIFRQFSSSPVDKVTISPRGIKRETRRRNRTDLVKKVEYNPFDFYAIKLTPIPR